MQSSFTSVGLSMDVGAGGVVDGDMGRAGVVESRPDGARDANDSGPEGGDRGSAEFPVEQERHGLLTCEVARVPQSGSSSGNQRT